MEPGTLLDFDLGEGESSDDSDFRIEDHAEESDDYSVNTDEDNSKYYPRWSPGCLFKDFEFHEIWGNFYLSMNLFIDFYFKNLIHLPLPTFLVVSQKSNQIKIFLFET